ncbi:hypothetical protein N8I74_00275 [Chitiniphilus purpureus]|uniref:Uncharacterized protein n=1 Tax=Chitiniphilus purpureus TaxID=2981137 RepID=A0ABY6DM90_9NEIS|nr:hypothetical protein [Chitiniphilus sp. CD1]UXY15487.1 hypothetical protein N8I74_00275 [Chitiniphilus sp. CD1]
MPRGNAANHTTTAMDLIRIQQQIAVISTRCVGGAVGLAALDALQAAQEVRAGNCRFACSGVPARRPAGLRTVSVCCRRLGVLQPGTCPSRSSNPTRRPIVRRR